MKNKSHSHTHSASGRTLIELLIAMVIGLVIMGAALAIYSSTTSSSRSSEAAARLNENATITLGILQQQLRLGGYSSIVGSPTYVIRKNFTGPGIRGCTGGFSAGSATATFATIACNNDTTKSDALVVRYEADTSNTNPVTTALGTVVPSNCVSAGITATTASEATSTLVGAAVLPNYTLADNRYYVKNTGTPSGGPELYCTGATGEAALAAFSTPQPIMEGVERIEVTYGVAASAAGTVTTAYMTAQAIDTAYAADSNRWNRVISARICLQVRSTDTSDKTSVSTLSTTNKYYDCANAQQTSTDGYLRRTYTSTVLLKNKIPLQQ